MNSHISLTFVLKKSCYIEADGINMTDYETLARFRRDIWIVTSGINVPKIISTYADLIPTVEVI